MCAGSKVADSIVVNGRFFSQPITGVQRYAYELLRALDHLLNIGALDPLPVTIAVPVNVRRLPSYSFLKIEQAGRRTGHAWEQVDLPLFARGRLLFTPCGGAPVLHRPHVITIHDAGPFSTPRAYTALYRNYYKTLQRYLSRTAAHIITVSEFSKVELMRALGIPKEKVSFTYLSGEHILRCDRDSSILTRHGLDRGKYVLAVGSKNINKNLSRLIQACSLLPCSEIQVAIAGGMNATVFRSTERSGGLLKELGAVSDSELRALYESAACFAFPSLYEGFGLPPLEALSLGCPVVASNVASLPEVFGDAAIYCDPRNPQDIADKIFGVLEGEGPGRELRLAHAGRFRWHQCAQETWAILRRAVLG